MPQFRQDFITKEWVIVAPERAKRPDQFAKNTTQRQKLLERDVNCPFCPGNESQTPSPVMVCNRGDNWNLRVVANKFAAVNAGLSPNRKSDGKFLSAEGFGIAEVVIESPRHNTTLALLSREEIRGVLGAYKNRFTALASIADIDLITIFRNHGPTAGTSLVHPHSQIIATPIVPPHIRHLTQQSLIYHDSFGRCAWCDMIEEELSQEARITMETRHHVAFCPYASRTPFEMMVIPKRHYARIDGINADELDDLALTMQVILKKLHAGLSDPDYNFVIRTAPISDGELHFDHLRVIITPRVTTPAGFEIGSGIFINTMPPEDAAAFLRDV